MLAVGEFVFGELAEREIKMSSGFAAGVGSTKEEFCGAFSAGVMIIGGLLGRTDPAVDDSRCQALIRRYRERFLSRFATLTCEELRKEKYGSGGEEPCSVLVERAAALLLEVIGEERKEGNF